jgi:Flp pilus assembly protein TadD
MTCAPGPTPHLPHEDEAAPDLSATAGSREEGLASGAPSPSESAYRQATDLAGQGRLAEAVPLFTAALQHDPGTGKYWVSLATALLSQERLAETKALLERFVEIGPSDEVTQQLRARLVAFLFDKGRAHQEAGRAHEAERFYDIVLLLDAQHAPTLHLAGLAALEAGRLDDATALIELAAQADPDTKRYAADLAEARGAADRASAHLLRVRAGRPVFYIESPGYTPLSGGPMALHMLCHYLNELGYEAYLRTDAISGALRTPILTETVYKAHRAAERLQIAVYPEVFHGNALQCPAVIRFLLNKPGARSEQDDGTLHAFWTHPDRQAEYILHYAEEFQVPYLTSHPLFMPIVDERIFHQRDMAGERKGFLVYSHRVAVTPDMIPDWANPYTMIEMKAFRTPQELAELYNRSEALITFERTGAMAEAMMCGCPVVAIPNPAFTEMPMFSRTGNLGFGWGSGREQLDWAAKSVTTYQNAHRAYATAAVEEVRDRIAHAVAFLKAGERWSVPT